MALRETCDNETGRGLLEGLSSAVYGAGPDSPASILLKEQSSRTSGRG